MVSMLKYEFNFLKKHKFITLLCLFIFFSFNLTLLSDIPKNIEIDIIKAIYGNVNAYIIFVYWIYLIIMYLIVLANIWRPAYNNYDMNFIIRFLKIEKYSNYKIVVGLLTTFLFVVFCILGTIITALFLGVDIEITTTILYIIILLTFNLYLHGLLWFIITEFISNNIATFTTLGIFYFGAKFPEKKFPFHFGLYEQLLNKESYYIFIVVIAHLVLIYIFKIIIKYYLKKQDLYIKLL